MNAGGRRMNETLPYNFFLKTENFEPLMVLVERLHRKIDENQAVIARLTQVIDDKFRLPRPSNDGEIDQKTDKEMEKDTGKQMELDDQTGVKNNGVLPMSQLLTSKYHLDKITLTQSYEHVANPKLRQLLTEVAKLKVVQRASRYKNHELFKVYQDYELLIITKILPRLRNDILEYNQQFIRRGKSELVEWKLNQQSQLWSRYQQYLVGLQKLRDCCYAIIDVYERELKHDDLKQFYVKIATIDQLVHYLT